MGEDEYRVYMIPMPGDIRGVTSIDNDGFASIYINTNLSPEAARRTFKHEQNHVKNNDFYNDKDIMTVEQEAG